jgi:hypothetical protein
LGAGGDTRATKRRACFHLPQFQYFWLTNGGLPAGAVFREKVGMHLTAAKRAELEKLSAGFHPDPMTVFHDLMHKGSAQPK